MVLYLWRSDVVAQVGKSRVAPKVVGSNPTNIPAFSFLLLMWDCIRDTLFVFPPQDRGVSGDYPYLTRTPQIERRVNVR